MKLTRSIKRFIKAVLSPLSNRWVYTARRGLARGMKVKGGYLFIPKHAKEDAMWALSGMLRDQVVYDVGANIGVTTLFFAREVGEKGLVVAFEPVPENLKRLKDNVAVNHLQNVRVYEVALGDTEDTVEISFSPDSVGIATLRSDVAQRYHGRYRMYKVSIKVLPLDLLLERENLPPPNLIKIDVEGYEYSVLQGARRTIEQYKPRLLVEIHGANRDDAMRNAKEIYTLLNDLGYEIFSMVPNNTRLTLENLATVRGNLWDCIATGQD